MRGSGAAEPRGRRRPLVKLAATAGAFVLGLVACEVAVRLAGLAPAREPERRGRTLRASDDPVLAAENDPGAVQTLTYFDRRAGEPGIVEMRVNAQGFRGAEVAVPKPDGVLRIACIGDSHTFGFGVADDETWPVALERRLRARFPERSIEVLNCGVNNYDSLQEVIWMERRVLAFEPDLVLQQYYVNDTAIRGADAEPPTSDWLFELAHPRRGGWIRALRDRSRFADLAFDWLYRERGLAVYAELRMAGYRESSPGWRRVTEALRRARDGLAERRIGYALVLYPFLLREGERLTSHAAFAQVAAFAERERIACFDAEPAFAEHDVDRLRISTLDYHGNAAANAIFGRAVGEWLVERGLVAR